MAQKSKNTTATLRQNRILDILKDKEEASIPQLAEMFTVCEMTIRRDLDALQSNGHVRRTHGGAMPAERMVFEFDFTARRRSQKKEKQAIAAEAARLIKPGQKLILDTGTTTLELALILKDFNDITIVTPSLAAASVLQFSPNVQTVLLGGILRKGSPDLTGVVTEKTLEMFAVDMAFLGADGIGWDGTLYVEDLRIAKVDQEIRKRAQEIHILCDSSKIGKTALATNGFINEASALITDSKIPAEYKEKFEKMGANIVVAGPDT